MRIRPRRIRNAGKTVRTTIGDKAAPVNIIRCRSKGGICAGADLGPGSGAFSSTENSGSAPPLRMARLTGRANE